MQREESASKRYPLRRVRTDGGPCKTLKLGDPLPKYVRIGDQGRYVLESELKLPRKVLLVTGYRWEAANVDQENAGLARG